MKKKKINVLVVEDSQFYNDMLSRALKQSSCFIDPFSKYQLVLQTYTDPFECIRNIKTGSVMGKDIIAFIDYYMGNGVNGLHIIKLLKSQNKNALAVLVSQSKAIGEKNDPKVFDYFVFKDKFAPALCRLYLEQFIENKSV